MWIQNGLWRRSRSFHIPRLVVLAVVCCLVLAGCGPADWGFPMHSARDLSSDIAPDDFDMGEASDRGIGAKDAYVLVQYRYLTVLSDWLKSMFDFASIDRELADADLAVVPMQDYYRGRDQLGSGYIYLRNNIHPERLTVDQISLMRQETTPENRNRQLDVVKQTHADVLAVQYDYMRPDVEYIISYGSPGDQSLYVPNTALVFYLSYKEPRTEDDAAFDAVQRRTETAVTRVSEQIQRALSSEIDTDVVIIDGYYLEYTEWQSLDGSDPDGDDGDDGRDESDGDQHE